MAQGDHVAVLAGMVFSIPLVFIVLGKLWGLPKKLLAKFEIEDESWFGGVLFIPLAFALYVWAAGSWPCLSACLILAWMMEVYYLLGFYLPRLLARDDHWLTGWYLLMGTAEGAWAWFYRADVCPLALFEVAVFFCLAATRLWEYSWMANLGQSVFFVGFLSAWVLWICDHSVFYLFLYFWGVGMLLWAAASVGRIGYLYYANQIGFPRLSRESFWLLSPYLSYLSLCAALFSDWAPCHWNDKVSFSGTLLNMINTHPLLVYAVFFFIVSTWILWVFTLNFGNKGVL